MCFFSKLAEHWLPHTYTCECCAGAGKTSVINTIFRLMELDQGAINIDGLDIAKLGLAQLRNSMAIIPQVSNASMHGFLLLLLLLLLCFVLFCFVQVSAQVLGIPEV